MVDFPTPQYCTRFEIRVALQLNSVYKLYFCSSAQIPYGGD